jgi:hypothetical protein
MTASKEPAAAPAPPSLEGAFAPDQAKALQAALAAAGKGLVTREEFARLEGMLQEILAQMPKHQVSTEEIVVIAAAITAFLGKPVRVRSVRRLQSDGSSAWSRQGRVFIQASHNLGMLKHGG